MAEENNEEKTEDPTAKRLDEARERGQVPISKELMGASLFLMAMMAIQLGAQDLLDLIGRASMSMFQLPVDILDDEDGVMALLNGVVDAVFTAILPVCLVAFFGVAAVGFVQIGFRLSSKALAPKFSKLNPITGVKKLFGLDNVVQVVQSLAKFTLVGVVCWFTIAGTLERIVGLAGYPIDQSMFLLVELIFLLAFRVAGGLMVIGLIDLVYRRWKHNKDLKMSKQDVKDESKQAEGNPEVKGKIREVQRKMAMQRMKSDVEGATVVVRNPTHFAVALRYEDGDAAPRVVAKGRALMALTIIRIAEEAGVEVLENKPLARELYRTVKVGDWIPERLFKAVAKVLAYVFRKKKKKTPRRGLETAASADGV